MTTVENSTELIDANISAKTISIPIRVTMRSEDSEPYEFTTSIDEFGRIVLTPSSNKVEFTDVKTQQHYEDVEILSIESVTTESENYTIKEESLNINASMLLEEDNNNFDIYVDEIGQIVIQPQFEDNSFISATIDDSLSLITEDMQTVEYFGYRLVNNGDGWDVYDYTNTLVEEGVATLSEAKIVACSNEIDILENLVESIDSEKTETDSTEKNQTQNENSEEEQNKPDVTASVVIESLRSVTNNFEDINGVIRYDTLEEKQICLEELSKHYNVTETSNSLISYDKGVSMSDDHKEIIDRFMQGDIMIFQSSGYPKIGYEHIHELDDDNTEFFYDSTVDAIVTYDK